MDRIMAYKIYHSQWKEVRRNSMNHRDFSKVIKNKTVVDTSIDIGNFTFTPYSDGVRIKSKDPSKPVEKGIGYIRTPDNVEIKFTPYAYSIDRDAGSSTTIEIRGELDKVIDPKKSLLTKRMNLPVYNGLNPKPHTFLSDGFFPESLKKEIAIEFKKTEELLNGKSTEFCELFKEIDAAYNEYIKAERIDIPVIIEKKVKAPHEIEKVIFNPPATIVYWKDGTKTVVKVQEGDVFDPEKGLAMAFFKKMHGNTGNYNNIIHKWVGDYKPDPVHEFDSITIENVAIDPDEFKKLVGVDGPFNFEFTAKKWDRK
jgi:hypothetical protein